jgi:hypothetical protein
VFSLSTKNECFFLKREVYGFYGRILFKCIFYKHILNIFIVNSDIAGNYLCRVTFVYGSYNATVHNK